MKKIYRLTENELVKLIIESTMKTGNLGGRDYYINSDGTVSIKNNKNKYVNIRFYTKIGEINVVSILPTEGGYKITGRKGNSEVVGSDTIELIISFVDTGKPSEIESGSFFKPNLHMKKVN